MGAPSFTFLRAKSGSILSMRSNAREARDGDAAINGSNGGRPIVNLLERNNELGAA